MADRLIDKYFDPLRYPDSAKEAFLRLAGNYQQNVSENTLKAWAHELESIDPSDFEKAVKSCIRSELVTKFPRWCDFAKFLPVRSTSSEGKAWYDPDTGEWGGPWPGIGANLTLRQVENLESIRQYVADHHAKMQGSKLNTYGNQRQKFLDFLKKLLGEDPDVIQAEFTMVPDAAPALAGANP